jgi:Icc-related predicted phosphoesterase
MATKTTVLTVSDLHRSAALLEALREAVVQHKPDLVAVVGDVLHGFDDNRHRVSVLGCAKLLSQLPGPEVVFVRGNHEDDAWLLFAEAWTALGRPLHALHGEVFTQGPMRLVGFPCSMGDEKAFLGNRAALPMESEGWLPGVMQSAGPAARTLWLMHEPPTGTPLSERGSLVEGNPDWVTAIERFSPWLTVSGHDHITPIRSNCWHHRMGQTTCVNVGQADHDPLHYCLIEAEFEGSSPSLPAKMQVTAYPWQETLELPSGTVISKSGRKSDSV